MISRPLSSPLSRGLSSDIGTGPHPSNAYLWMPGSAGNYATVFNDGRIPVGDLAIEVHARPDNWLVGNQTFIASNGALGLMVKSLDGNLALQRNGLSYCGTKISAAAVAFRIVAIGLSPTAVDFYQSLDGESFTHLATGTLSTVPDFTGDPILLGTETAGGAEMLSGILDRVRISQGLVGETVLDVDVSSNARVGDTSFTATTGQAVTLVQTGGTPIEIREP